MTLVQEEVLTELIVDRLQKSPGSLTRGHFNSHTLGFGSFFHPRAVRLYVGDSRDYVAVNGYLIKNTEFAKRITDAVDNATLDHIIKSIS